MRSPKPKKADQSVSQEVIRQRLLDLMEVASSAMSSSPGELDEMQAMMIGAGQSLIVAMIETQEISKLTQFVSSLAGIARAVSDLGSLPQQYEDEVLPHLEVLFDLLK